MDGNEHKMAAGRYSIELERKGEEPRLANLKYSGSTVSNDTVGDFAKSRDKAAEKFNESPATVARAVKVIKEGAVELIQAVEQVQE